MTSGKPSIVAFGGGTGMASLLHGLKRYTDRITAVVTVSDDGGSSGRLRKELDAVPPGDIRNCLVALAPDGSLMADLFQYRFEESDLRGHPLGNLLITALTKLTGDFDRAIAEASRWLQVRGHVIPAAIHKLALVAVHPDGSKSTGEVEISRSQKAIARLELRPDPGRLRPEVAQAIAAADLFVCGPGSLYTSVLPNLLIGGTLEAVEANGAPRLYVCNIMTQPGETTGFTAADHVHAVEAHTRPGFVDWVLVNDGAVPPELAARYAAEGQEVVSAGPEPVVAGDHPAWQVLRRDVVSAQDYVRHDSDKLARAIMELAEQRVRA